MKKIIILFLFLLFFHLLSVNSFASHGNNTISRMGPKFFHNNGSTDWEVAFWYRWNDGTTGPTRIWFAWTNIIRNCSFPSSDWCNATTSQDLTGNTQHPEYELQWGTTCRDPIVQSHYSLQDAGRDANGNPIDVYLFNVNVTSGRAGADNSGARISYAYGNTITNRTDACPFPCGTPSCSGGRCGSFRNNCGYGVTSPQVNCGGCGDNFCGSGGNRCDMMDRFCNTNNYCDTRVLNNNTRDCRGRNDCCFNDGDCRSNEYCHNLTGADQCRVYARIGGQVYLNNSNNPISGVRVQMRNANATDWNNLQAQDTTGNNGRYNFPQLRNPSDHDVRIINPDACLYDVGSANPRQNITATPGLDNINFRLEYDEYRVVGNLYWDPTPGIPGDEVLYSDASVPNGRDGVRVRGFTMSGNLIGEDFTNVNSRYNIPGFRTDADHNRRYEMRVATGNNNFSIFPGNANRPPHYVIGGNTRTVNVGCGNTTQHFYVSTINLNDRFSISGGVYEDLLDPQGVKDPTEPYLASEGTEIINIRGLDPAGTGFAANPGTDTFNNGSNNKDYAFSSSGFQTPVELPAGRYRVTFRNMARPDFIHTRPVPPPSPPYVDITVGHNCTPISPLDDNYVDCDALGNITNVNFGIRVRPINWWIRGVGGDMRSDNILDNRIPGTLGEYYMSNPEDSPLLSPGIIFGRFNLGGTLEEQRQKANPNFWIIRDEPFAQDVIRTSYSFINSSLTKAGTTKGPLFGGSAAFCTGTTGPNCTFKPGFNSGIYYSGDNTNVTLTGADYVFDRANSYYVVLIDGNLTIDQNILVPSKTTSVIFIVRGNIIITPRVTNIQGIFSADGTIHTRSISDPVNDVWDQQLNVQGSLIGNARRSSNPIDNDRDLGPLNDTTPSINIIFRPDFVLNAPPLIRYSTFKIQELAPGE